ncbi:MAG: transposase, partial [Candidatus Competibacteraceae bacterium]|nr:transposase [Candidatus Competibacteraceae bacterium]
LRISLGVIQKITSQAEAIGLDWPTIEQMDDRQLAQAIYPQSDVRTSGSLQLPDWHEVHQSLKAKGVTKQLLWEEYSQQYPNRSYSYPQYCHLYKAWLKKQKRSMRQLHQAGDKLFVDYAGQTVPIVLFDYRETRAGHYPKIYLDGFNGSLLTDGYSGYDACRRGGRQQTDDARLLESCPASFPRYRQSAPERRSTGLRLTCRDA